MSSRYAIDLLLNDHTGENRHHHGSRTVPPWWNGPTAVMMTIFPSVIIQQQVNSVSTRHIQPNGHGSFDFVWTHFGFEDDTPEMTQRRLIQANLFGPAGFVSADDGEVIELSQCGFEQKPSHRAVAELGGYACENTDHMVTETLIRGMPRMSVSVTI